MRLLVVEDNIEVQQTLQKQLRKSGFAVDCVDDGTAALEQATIINYDLILLDLNLPDIDGFEVCRQLRDNAIETPIIMVTARGESENRTYGLDVGADDYLVKPFDMDELRARIQAVLRRVRGKSRPELSLADITIYPQRLQAEVAGELLILTPKEYEILHYLFIEYPNVCSLESIIDHVWDDESNPFSNAARVHVMNLRRKIMNNSKSLTLETIKGKGYRLCIR